MEVGKYIIDAIIARRDRNLKSKQGPLGDFYRNGGNDQLYMVPASTGSLVIDAGGYVGDWTSAMLIRYGCRSEIFEPVPIYADHCKQLFEKNELIRVHTAALGGTTRVTKFKLAASSTSEYNSSIGKSIIEAAVLDISQVFDQLKGETISCLKLNIYEVLERLLSTNQIIFCKSILIQFHPHPEDWEKRHKQITSQLKKSHKQEWCYPMVWEKWVR